MKGNVVTAAKLVGMSLILSALILVGGINLAVALHRAKLAEPASGAHEPGASVGLFPSRYSREPGARVSELQAEPADPCYPERYWSSTREVVPECCEPPEVVVPIQCPQPAADTPPARCEPLSLAVLPGVFARYSTHPIDRMSELLVDSEPSGPERRFWKLTDPAELTYEHVSGPLEPCAPSEVIVPIQCPQSESPTAGSGVSVSQLYMACEQRLAQWLASFLCPSRVSLPDTKLPPARYISLSRAIELATSPTVCPPE